ncbi:MAG: M24 family metallopeptidase [Hyphomicrobiales bacterium]
MLKKLDIRDDPNKPSYLNDEAADTPLKNPIDHDTLVKARGYRQKRLREQLEKHDVAAILLFDPLNIRYATDCSDMQVWTMHNAARYAVIVNGGPAICFEYKQAMHLAESLETVDEVRPATTWFYFSAGSNVRAKAAKWAAEIADIVKQYGGGNMRLAVDKMEPVGVDLLRGHGIEIVEGQEITETAREVKSADELTIMDWTITVCEAGMWRMREYSAPGRTENEIWAQLHYENIRNGGEWIETRLLAIGERTNPWFQESSDHVGQEGDLLSFDTDLIGPYGYCSDISRSWTIGLVPPTDEQKRLYEHAYNQIMFNRDLIKPGMSYHEFNEKSWKMPEEFHVCRYGVALHGVGLCDEYPAISTHVDFGPDHHDDVFEPGNVLCVESCTGVAGGRECVKLEIQVLVTEDGVKQLDQFPFEDWV